jgi:hypothetical protein
MTRGGRLLFGKVCDSDGQTYERYSANNAGPSTTLRFGRDDKGRVVTFQKGRGLDGRSYEQLPREYPGLKSETWANPLIFVATFFSSTLRHLTAVFAVDWVIPFPGGFALLTVAVLVIVVPDLAVTFT